MSDREISDDVFRGSYDAWLTTPPDEPDAACERCGKTGDRCPDCGKALCPHCADVVECREDEDEDPDGV